MAMWRVAGYTLTMTRRHWREIQVAGLHHHQMRGTREGRSYIRQYVASPVCVRSSMLQHPMFGLLGNRYGKDDVGWPFLWPCSRCPLGWEKRIRNGISGDEQDGWTCPTQ